MRSERKAAVFAILLVAVAAFSLWALAPLPGPPALSVLSIEKSEVYEDAEEMWLVTLGMSNPAPTRPDPIYVRDDELPIEVRLTNHWLRVEGKIGACRLSGSLSHRIQFLMPATADACRLRFSYAGAVITRGRIAWFSGRLPAFIRLRLPYLYWRWVGFVDYAPGSNWRRVNAELPLPVPPRVLRPERANRWHGSAVAQCLGSLFFHCRARHADEGFTPFCPRVAWLSWRLFSWR